MIGDVLLGILLVAITLVLLATLAIQNRIGNNIQAAIDNVHRIRAGFERERHRFQELVETVERLEHHTRGPGRAFGPPPASSSKFSTDEIDPNP